MPKKMKKRRNTEVRRRQIVDAARELIIKYGSEHITGRRIAKEIGITEGAISRHFKSKRDILSFLIEDVEANLVADIEREMTSGATPLQVIDNTMKSHISSIEQRRGVTFLVIAEIISLGDKKLNRQASEVLNRYTGRIRDILSEGVKSGEIRDDVAPETAAVLLSATIQGLVNLWALSNYSFSLEESYLSLWRMLREVVIRK